MEGNNAKSLLFTPEGVRDIYGEDCERRIKIEDQLRDTMKSYGFLDEEENRIKINPICGKIGGGFDVEII